MRDSSTAELHDQPPGPPRTLEQIPLQELYRPVQEGVLLPVTPPQEPAELPIDIDDEDKQPPDQPQQSTQPPLTPPIGGLEISLPDSPMQDSIPGSPGQPPHDPPPPTPQKEIHTQSHWFAAPGTPPWLPQASTTSGQPPPPLPPPAAPIVAPAWSMPPLWWPPMYPGPTPVAGRVFPPSGGTMPTTTQSPTPMALLSPSPLVQPVTQTLDQDDDEDLAEDAPMRAQPLLLARRPRASSEPAAQPAI